MSILAIPFFLLIFVLETKGQETRRDKEKRKALAEWVEAVNGLSEYGEWCNDVSYNVADVDGMIQRFIENREYLHNSGIEHLFDNARTLWCIYK